MGWISYYNLLSKYDGDIARATTEELKSAAKSNSNDPHSALDLAEKKYREEKENFNKSDLKNFKIIKSSENED